MAATLLDILMILSLGILAGTGTGLLIGFAVKKQKREWAGMEKKDILFNILLILACTIFFCAALAYYLFWYPGTTPV